MSDGAVLMVDVSYPTDPVTGARAVGPFPVLLTQTPYLVIRRPPATTSSSAATRDYPVERMMRDAKLAQIHVEGEHFTHGLAENMAAQVLAIAANYSHILFPVTASGKNIIPRLAARLDVGQISDVTKVDSPDTFERPIYAGNAIATVQSLDEKKVITVRTTGFDPAAATGGTAVIETVNAVADSGKSRVRSSTWRA